MPNYVKHLVTIHALDGETFDKVKKQIISQDENGVDTFSFNSIIPMPESLNITCGSMTDNGIKYFKGNDSEKAEIKKRYKEDTFDEVIKLGHTALMNMAKYGYPTWYEWRIANWGTKWDVCNPETPIIVDTEIKLEFQTAWNTPQPIFKKLAEQYPELTIVVEYADESWGSNCGVYEYANGHLVLEESRDEDFARELWDII